MDLTRQLEQLRNAHKTIEDLLLDNRKKLSKAEQARLELEKNKAQELLDRMEEKQSVMQQRNLLWATIRSHLAPEVSSERIALIRDNNQIIIRIPNELLFEEASVIIRRGVKVKQATIWQDPQEDSNTTEESLLFTNYNQEEKEPFDESSMLSDAEYILSKISQLLNKNLPETDILVEGHTDNIPISNALMDQFPSNWELSSARATATVRYLQEFCNVDPSRMIAVGRADTLPITSNETAEGRKNNRRVEIILEMNDNMLARMSLNLEHTQRLSGHSKVVVDAATN